MLIHSSHQEFFMQAYSECNEYARTQPKARDQVILFYSAVCAFYLSQLSQLTTVLFWALTAAMFIIGILCSLIVINFRSWVIQYGKAAEVIGRLLVTSQQLSTLDQIIAFIHADCQNPSRPKRPFFFRMGNLIVVSFCFITLAPFAAVYDKLVNSCQLAHIAIIVSALIYFLLLIVICFFQLSKAEKINDSTWIIRFSGITQLP